MDACEKVTDFSFDWIVLRSEHFVVFVNPATLFDYNDVSNRGFEMCANRTC